MSLHVVSPRSRRVVASFSRTLRIAAGGIGLLRRAKPPHGHDACMILLQGERLIQGSLAEIRHSLRQTGLRTFVAVHYPVVPELGLDLITLEPRCFGDGPLTDRIALNVRLAASPDHYRSMFHNLRDATESWAMLAAAVNEYFDEPCQAMDRLRRLWTREPVPSMQRALVLRNLIVTLIAQSEQAKARELITLGLEAFPEYAELRWLSGVLHLIDGDLNGAKAEADRSRGMPDDGRFTGSRGEGGYRAHWLSGLWHTAAGHQEAALHHFFDGVRQRPSFRPSVDALLEMRLGTAQVERLSNDLCGLARREPSYKDAVIGYLILHRCFDAARHLADTPEREALVEDACRPFDPSEADGQAESGVVIQAPFFELSSSGRIARELARGLSDACLEPYGFSTRAPREFRQGDILGEAMLRHPRQLDLTIRLCWPPDFARPPRGRLACLFPWEYRGLPSHWVRQINRNVDEVWTPSRFTAGVLLRAGVDRDLVRVIPHGVDTEIFCSEGPTVEAENARGFAFLFVGGALARKGFDLLLDAYQEAFTSSDDVSLVVKEFGSAILYRHNSLLSSAARFVPGTRLPHVIVNTGPLDDAALAGLYRRCDCLVHPYRGEGFGMTLAEAMACGKPVITTGQGPAPEFCSSDTSWLIPAEWAPVQDQSPPAGEMTEPLHWLEPSFEALVQAMRDAYENRDEVRRRGAEAARRIHATHNWPRIVEMYSARIMELTGAGVAA